MLGMERVHIRVGVKRVAALLAGVLLAVSVAGVVSAQGGTVIEVNSYEDNLKANDGACTLREAILSANSGLSGKIAGECAAGSGDDTILLPPGRYTLSRSNSGSEDAPTTGDLDITSNVTIVSAGPGLVVIDGGGISDRVFHVLHGAVSISGVSVVDGTAGGNGGGIKVDAGASVIVQNATFTGNEAVTGAGGALYVEGAADLTNVTITANSAPAGSALAGPGSVTLRNTIVSNDSCSATISAQGANLFHNAGGCPAGSVSGDPLLAPWSGGDGIFALQVGSPASGAAVGNCPATDQLGEARPQPAGCDLGAYELKNDAPEAVADSFATNEDIALVAPAPGVLANDTDPENDALSAAIVAGTSNGSLTFPGDGSFVYTPNANFNGGDSFTYTAADGEWTSNVATVSITVNAVNDAPVAVDDAYSTDEDVALSIPAAGVLGNDTDVENDALSAAVVAGPSNGALTFPGDGSFVYTPNANFNGGDSFTYTAADGGLNSNVATVSIAVNAVNDAPVALDDAYSTDEDVALSIPAAGVLGNDTDVENDALSAAVVAGPSNGALTFPGDGSFVYTPNANFNGGDSFTYRAADGGLNSNVATVTIAVNAVNSSPVAEADAYSTGEDVALNISARGVLGNDMDPDDDALSAVLISGPSYGTLTLNADGSFLYDPFNNFSGTDMFEYAASDGSAASAPAVVTVVVDPDATIEVNTTSDVDDGVCDWQHCSLREAINFANSHPNGEGGPDPITFEILNTDTSFDANSYIIAVQSALPAITDAVFIDGATQVDGQIVLDGGNGDYPGLVLTATAGGSTIRGLVIRNFGRDGVRIEGSLDDVVASGSHVITGNTIADNGGNGVTVINSANNRITDNNITRNGGLPLDLGDDGRTTNDAGDGDIGANFVQNYPVLYRAAGQQDGSNTTRIWGRLNSRPDASFTVQVFASAQCNTGENRLLTTSPAQVMTDETGDIYFTLTANELLPDGAMLVATATDADYNTSEYSDCIVVSIDNDSWPRALRLDASGAPAAISQYLDQAGQARWYKFAVQPDSQLMVTLTNLPENYDLTIYKDIAQVYESLVAPQDEADLTELSAEFAPSAFSPSSFSPSAFSPSAFSPSAFSPSAFSPSSFSPSVFSPSSFSPSAFSPSSFSPSAFSPSSFSPSSFSPSSFSPSSFSPSAFSPSSFSPSAFSSAQSRSLVGVSAFDGAAAEGIAMNTWLNSGDFYVRVRGRDGAFSLSSPFSLEVEQVAGDCSAVPSGNQPGTGLGSITPGAKSIILIDSARMSLDAALLGDLNALAARPEVGGVVVDVNSDPHVAAANATADGNVTCPFAKNIVAQEIKDIVDAYRGDAQPSPLEYVVLVGNDNVIPFFRYPDNALLGPESNYVPPVSDFTASQASLRLGYVLSQDAYGSEVGLSLNATEFPIPLLAVGRLAETPADIRAQLAAYLGTPDGVMPTSGTLSTLVTGYDFLEDAANAVKNELELGAAAPVDSLITPQDVSPLDATIDEGGTVWTADDLKDLLLNNRYDIAYLAGHFSANSALAADYRTIMLTTDVEGSAVDMTNLLVYSAGCHSGYNIVNEHGVPGVTFEPDWAQAFARKGATLIAGTGYQYGDTEFLEYSERLYLYFTQQLRQGSGPVPIGKAMVAAKQTYLAGTPVLRGIHEKALLEATIFGLPMYSVNMPGARSAAPSDDPAAMTTVPVDPASPGGTLGLQVRDLEVIPSLTERVIELTDVDGGPLVTATWLEGDSGVVTNPAEPALPLVAKNVSVPSMVLRGIGLRTAEYSDTPNVTPLTGAPTTELRGVHSPFLSDVWFPLGIWNVNYFDALDGDALAAAGDVTRLYLTPAQHRSTSPGSLTNVRRQYDRVTYRLFYSDYVDTVWDEGVPSAPALADAPTILQILSGVSGGELHFRVRAVGNPAAGMQEVWITYTATNGPWNGRWQSLDLVQNSDDSTLWEGTLPLGANAPADVRYAVQATNGVGLVTWAENLGRYYTPGGDVDPSPAVLTLSEPLAATEGPFGTQAAFSAQLMDATVEPPTPLANKPVTFGLGPQERLATTDANGWAQAAIPLLGLPGDYPVRAAFSGDTVHAAAADESAEAFTIRQQSTTLTLMPQELEYVVGQEGAVLASLVDGDARPQLEQTVLFELTSGSGSIQRAIITNYLGEAVLDLERLADELSPGVYTLRASFAGNATHLPAEADGQLTVADNQKPVCGKANAEPRRIWPPTGDFVPVQVLGVTDADGDPIAVQVDDVYQDEEVDAGASGPDAMITAEGVSVRAERDAKQDGRVYHIVFTAADGRGGQCTGEVRTGVTEDLASGFDAIDGGRCYDSLTGTPGPSCPAVADDDFPVYMPRLDLQ